MGRKAATKDTPEKEVNDVAMMIFLAELADSGTITAAADVAGIVKKTAYRWRESDKEFAEAWDDALEIGTDGLEREAIRRGRDGLTKPVYQGGRRVGEVQEYSDTLLIFMLKARRPERYRERATFEHTGKGGKDLPVAPAGVLVVPGMMPDTATWSALAQRTATTTKG